ncbi:GntR family transcriptional regulator [Microbulbifer sp. OS29]|uniref:GntR family transcriptional regulator n=1 Tax=Microbulbifer okhotskensis TaxID=2926617 RepID=A0A9X2J3V0_9GAMM|nr:GntR family transcriptional regulator [Microbulbifer okhotskensis]MCO1333433.1 GntR family transcriptional regulator [Microbulbifer okhotskensis]
MGLYEKIKIDLQRGRFRPGEVLKQANLAELYAVSRIPVRDALQRLQSEGWLTPHGKRGVAVPLFDPLEVEDLYLMRMRIEPLLQTLALNKLNGEILGRARDILDTLEQDPGLSAVQIGALNWQFHACIYRAAGRPTLFAAVEQLHRQCGRYIGYQSGKLGYQNTSQSEHHHLLDSLQAGRGEEAAIQLRDHIEGAGKQLVNYLRTLSE